MFVIKEEILRDQEAQIVNIYKRNSFKTIINYYDKRRIIK